MADGADVLIENYRPGVMEKLGLGWDTLSRSNTRLIYCSVTGFGREGPYRHRPAYDSVASALSGFFNQTMFPDSPQVVGPAISDAVTGLYAVYGVLGALYEREKTGRGRLVDVTMVDSMIAFLRQPFESYFDTGTTPDLLERPSYSTAFALQCSDDKLLAIHVSTPEKFWQALVEAAERTELKDDPRFSSRERRIENFRALTAELRPTFRLRPRAEWMARLDQRDVPFAPINDFQDVEDDPQIRQLGTFAVYEHPVHGRMKTINRPVSYDRQARSPAKAPPMLGEHSDEVLDDYGIAADQRAVLKGSSERAEARRTASTE
jgi:formyl-CoA transferase